MSKILDRLTDQLQHKEGISRGQAKNMAKGILIKRGDLKKDGTDTAKGRKLGSMSAEQRSKAREAKYSGHKESDFVYSSKTNRSTLKKKRLGDN